MADASVDAAQTQLGPPPNPFVCNVCQKTYGRIDHLARHFRSHTNEKPFRCLECGKTFARADLLKRHTTLHASTGESGKKRKIRASQACAACATIKVKCDSEKPCKRCKTKGLECYVDTPSSSSSVRNSDRPSPSESWSARPQSTYQPNGIPESTTPQSNQRPNEFHGFHAPAIANNPTIPYPTVTPHYTSGVIPSHAVHVDVDTSLTDFLKDIIAPGDHSVIPPRSRLGSTWNGNFVPRDLMDFSQDLSMDFHDLDTVLSGGWDTWLDPSLDPPVVHEPTERTVSDMSTPSIDDSINMGSAAYNRSAWRWVPNHEKRNQDQALASILIEGSRSEQSQHQQPQRQARLSITQPLDLQDRDRMVALLLASCDKVNFQKIIALFPAPAVLDALLGEYLITMEHSIDSWIHIPSFRPGAAIPELLTLMIAGGAALSKTSHTQKLGYSLRDKARLAVWDMFERDNSKSRNLQALQAASICLDLGTWSGNKRTMELAESAVLPLVTMIRRSGGFRRSRGTAPGPTVEDDPQVLEQKWMAWIEAESFKRLAFHVFIYCVQVSVAFQIPPLISYAEVTLELPTPQALWRARSATEWRDQYFTLRLGQPLPSFTTAMQDAQVMGSVRGQIDLELTLYLILLSHWMLGWEFTQLSSVNKSQVSADGQWAGTLLASSKCQELRRLLDSFYMAIEEWNVFVPKEVHMISQLLRMNLSVAFEDLQILAGKEGEDEARRILPSLKQWYRSPECREAMWHAGQVLRAARRPAGRSPNASLSATPNAPWLRDFNAVALYHAGLAFWVYGLLARAIRLEQEEAAHANQQPPPSIPAPAIDYDGDLIRLDGDDEDLTAIARHHFIGMNKGRAVISTTSPFIRATDSTTSIPPRTEASRASRGPNIEAVVSQTQTVPLDDPKRVMEVIIHALSPASQPPDFSQRAPSQITGPQRPAMVENLIQLMRDLGEAASAF